MSEDKGSEKSHPAAEESELENLARQYADDFQEGAFEDPDDGSKDGISLEELSQAYAQAIEGHSHTSPSTAMPASSQNRRSTKLELVTKDQSQESPEGSESSVVADAVPEQGHTENGHTENSHAENGAEEQGDEEQFPVTPLSIVEAVLMVGRPDGGGITATEIAGLMRGVNEAEVDVLVEQLNQDYESERRAFRVIASGGGYRLQLAEDLEYLKQSFLGPARPVRLSQAAIDCLALISYQPGATREQLDEQLGKSAAAILNQLVRRQLLEMKREKIERKLVPRYYPTQRLLDLAGLESLDDLPTAEEWVDRV